MRVFEPGTSIDRYILRQVGLALVAVTTGLVLLVWLTQSLRFVELVVQHGLSLSAFLRLTGLLIPSFIAVILPITTFVSVQFVYQRLAGDRELTVMWSAGLSPFALARPAIAVACLSALAAFVLNIWLVPESLAAFHDFQWEIRNRAAAFLLQEGTFTPVSDDLTVYIRSRSPDGTLAGIVIDDARDKNAATTILAEHGRLLEGGDGLQVMLINGSRQEINHQTGRLDMLTFRENVFDLAQAQNSSDARILDISEASLHQLYHPPSFIVGQGIDRWRAEAHRRLSSPLTAISYSLVALLVVLSGSFRRYGGVLRPLVGVGAVVVLLGLGLALGSLAARDNALLPLVWLHAVLPGVYCAVALFGGPVRVGVRQALGYAT
jgi:lipopolysaccharide export system permease protein